MMELKQIKGNTWCFDDGQLIPVYMVSETTCILLDTGLYMQHTEIEGLLKEKGITPIGVIATHAHTDHAGGVLYFQKKYDIPVAMPVGEAGLCATMLDLKANFYVFPLHECQEAEDVCHMQGLVDRCIMPEDDICEIGGICFDIYHLPGHSADHIGIGTPDGVVYVGDAILGGRDLEVAKLPYYLAIEPTLESMEKLRQVKADRYICAHHGVYEDIAPIIDQNIVSLTQICDRITSLIDHPMMLSEIQQTICQSYKLLSGNIRKAELYERCIRSYVEYLVDTKRINVVAKMGMIMYEPWN